MCVLERAADMREACFEQIGNFIWRRVPVFSILGHQLLHNRAQPDWNVGINRQLFRKIWITVLRSSWKLFCSIDWVGRHD